jgi:hypothetical protein
MRFNPLHPAALGLAAIVAAAGPARAQASTCTWGCHCEGTGCSCNSRGSGSSCDTGGTGCAVTKCPTAVTLKLAPDGTPVRLASAAVRRSAAGAGTRAEQPLRMRWEYVSQGRSAARHCSGVVIARYFDPAAAAAVRRRQHTVSI